MSLIVQKFGGTSVADSQKILSAARKAIRAQQAGNQVVMVVSAMGKQTDMLVELAGQLSERPPAREMDMLLSTGEQVSVALMAMAIDSLGHSGVSLTGGQIGIRTDSTHTKARIKSISTERMQRLLDDGHIVIAAGFQGIDEDFNITTLGRGGSDTTAVALAAVLGATACEIYTDVDGVYTTDPRMLPEAVRVDRISYDEMLELASLGAGVMHNRSIEFAKKFGVPIHVRSSLSDAAGTMIVDDSGIDRPVGGCAVTKAEARITLAGVPDVPGVSWEIFSRIAGHNVTVDMIVQNVGQDGLADISFTVPAEELAVTLEAVNEAAELVGIQEVTHDANVSKISAVGLGMARQSGVADRMFAALAASDVNIQMITTSEIKISVLVKREQYKTALRAVHEAFELSRPIEAAPIEQPPTPDTPTPDTPTPDTPTPDTPTPDTPTPDTPTPNASAADRHVADIVSRLQGDNMEELLINDISLDQTQARVTIIGVPDQPGVAAKVFEQVAAAGVFVDMIVQSFGRHAGEATLSFTVQRADLDESLRVAKQLAKSFDCKGVTSSPEVAKLSVSGIGLRSHTGVAICTFRSLADAGINVGMINTSEVRVNVVVDGDRGEEALAQLQQAFKDALT